MAKTVVAEVNTKGPGKKNAAVEENEGKRALVSDVVVATSRVQTVVEVGVLRMTEEAGAHGLNGEMRET